MDFLDLVPFKDTRCFIRPSSHPQSTQLTSTLFHITDCSIIAAVMEQQDEWDHMHGVERDEPDFEYEDYIEDQLASTNHRNILYESNDDPIIHEIMKAKAMRDEYGADYFQSKGDVKCFDARSSADPYIAALWALELGDSKEHQSNLVKHGPMLKTSNEEWVAVKPPALESRVQELEAIVKELQDGMAKLQQQHERVTTQQIHTISGEIYRRTQGLIRSMLNRCYEIIEVANSLVRRSLNNERGGANGDGDSGENAVIMV